MHAALRTTRPTTLSGLNLAAPGALDALFAYHRARFGDARMDAAGGGDSGQGDAAAGDGDAGDGGDDAAGGQQGTEDDATGADDLAALSPAALAKMVRDLRRENGSDRVTARTQAADEARNELVQSLGKALGLVKDGDDAPKPEELTAQLTAAQAAQRQTAVELAVYRAAPGAGADPDAVLDSRAFLSKIAELDPGATDFTTAVTAALKAAVEGNPKLKTAQAAGKSSADHSAGGSGEGRTPLKPVPLHQAVSAAYGH